VFHHLVEDFRKGIACLCCLICLGPLVFGFGVWQFFEAPTDTERADNIKSMNHAIELWRDDYQQVFSAEQFLLGTNNQPPSVKLQRDSSKDFAEPELESYTPSSYFTSSKVIPSTTFQQGLKQSISFAASGNSSGTFSVSVNLFKIHITSDSDDDCDRANGQYTNGNCYYYYVLSDVCVKVSKQNGKMTSDLTYGGVGCWYSNGFPEDNGVWVPAKYEQVPYNNGAVFTQTFLFTSGEIRVRHNNDPYVYAQHLTLGTMSLGLTPKQKLMVGILLMGVGGFFMLPCCIFTVILVVCFRRRGHGHHHHHYEVVHH